MYDPRRIVPPISREKGPREEETPRFLGRRNVASSHSAPSATAISPPNKASLSLKNEANEMTVAIGSSITPGERLPGSRCSPVYFG